MVVRFGRSTFNHFESFYPYFALSRNRIHRFFRKVLTILFQFFVRMGDLCQLFHSNSLTHSILSIIVDKEAENAVLHNVMDCRLGRSIFHLFNIISIPRITNEL